MTNALRNIDRMAFNRRNETPRVDWARKVAQVPAELTMPETPWAEVATLVKSHEDLREAFRVTRLELIAAHEDTEGAKAQDEAAYAEALRKSKADPGTKAEDANALLIAGLERKLSALKVAMGGVRQDVTALRADKLAEWSAQVEADYTSAVDAMFTSFRAWVASSPVDTVGKVAELASLHDWVHQPDHHNKAQAFKDLGKLINDVRGVVAEVESERESPGVTKSVAITTEEANREAIRRSFSRSCTERHERPSEARVGNALRKSGGGAVIEHAPVIQVRMSEADILACKLTEPDD